METPNAQASPGSFASRRQKNLKKFRKHKEAQRHTLQTVVPSDVNTPVETEVASLPAPKPSTAVEPVNENDTKQATKVSNKPVTKKSSSAEKEAAIEQLPKPLKTEPVKVVPIKEKKVRKPASNIKTSESTAAVKLQTPPASPPVTNTKKETPPASPLVTNTKQEAPAPTKEAPTSPAPSSQKRRSDIIRKLARKNRGADSPRRLRQTVPTTSVITDSTSSAADSVTSSQEVQVGTTEIPSVPVETCELHRESEAKQEMEMDGPVDVSDSTGKMEVEEPLETFVNTDSPLEILEIGAKEEMEPLETFAYADSPLEITEIGATVEMEDAVDATPVSADSDDSPAEQTEVGVKEEIEINGTVETTTNADSQPEQTEVDVNEDIEINGTVETTTNDGSQPEQTEVDVNEDIEINDTVETTTNDDSQPEQMEVDVKEEIEINETVETTTNADSQPEQMEADVKAKIETNEIVETTTNADSQPEQTESDATEDQVKETETVASETNEMEETVDAIDADLCETSTSFDLRSIHDFPPEPIKTAAAALPSQDPSWDTAKVIFNEFEPLKSSNSKTKGDSLDMFDTTEAPSWTAAESVAFSQDFQAGVGDFAGFSSEPTSARSDNADIFFGQEVVEEKKESDLDLVGAGLGPNVDESTTERLAVEQAASEESNLSPRRRLSRVQVNNTTTGFGFNVSNLAMDSTDELDHAVSAAEENDETPGEMVEPDRDDEGLLIDKADDGSDRELWRIDFQLSKEERLQQYTSNDADDDNSSVGSSSQEEDNDVESLEDLPEVGYVSHSGEEDGVMEEDKSENELDDMPIEIVQDAPTFVIPTVEVLAAQEEPEVAPQENSLDNNASPSFSAEVGDLSDVVPEAPAVDPMQSISASFSVDNEASALAPRIVRAGEEGVTETKAGMEHIGYISNSSSSGSTSSDDQEISKRTKLEIAAEEVDSKANDNTALAEQGSIHPSGKAEGSEPLEQGALGPTDDLNQEQVASSDNTLSEHGELEESALLGISLVPSWGSSRKSNSSPSGPPKAGAGLGIPPRGSVSPSMLPPPPPPPLSKKKRKKKRKSSDGKAVPVPLLAPPPKEKFKKWEESKNRAAVHFSENLKSTSGEEDKNSIADNGEASSSASRRPPDMAPIECGAAVAETETWEEPPESPGRINIACGSLPGRGPWASFPKEESGHTCGGALAMAGLAGSPQNKPDLSSQFASCLSPVDAARSIALENAMKRANEGLARFNFNPSTRATVDAKSLVESDMVTSASTNSSTNAEETKLQPSLEAGGVEEPPTLTRKQMSDEEVYQNFPDSPHAFLQKLTSPSLSMSSPINDKDRSPLIHDSKMAEKVALASYAAALTFEEQYAASQENNESVVSPVATKSFDGDSQDGSPGTKELPSLFCAPEIRENFGHMAAGEDGIFFGAKFEQELTGIIEGQSEMLKDLVTGSTPSRESKEDEGPSNIQDLKGGAFSPWKNAVYARSGEPKRTDSSSVAVLSLASSCSSDAADKMVTLTLSDQESYSLPGDLLKIHQWLTYEVLKLPNEKNIQNSSDDVVRQHLANLLENNDNLNNLCSYVTDKINMKVEFENEERAQRNSQLSPRKKMKPFQIGRLSGQKSASVVAANFVSFMHRISKVSDTPSPFGEDNPFLLDLISTSIHEGNQEGKLSTKKSGDDTTMQKIVFRLCPADVIVKFAAQVCGFLAVGASGEIVEQKSSGLSSFDLIEASRAANPSPTKKTRGAFFGANSQAETLSAGDRKNVVPDGHPSPFESATKQDPKILVAILDFLGDPACVCRLKMVNRDCHKFVAQNEQRLMRDAVRLGGLSMNLRPAFWLWVTLEKCGVPNVEKQTDPENELERLEEAGRTGKWHNVIQRDVARSFGNMPPHKTGARLRTDSIVRALVTWGTNRIMKRGVKGGGNPPPSGSQTSLDYAASESDASQAPTDTVSDWGGVSPVASFTGSFNGGIDGDDKNSSHNEDGIKNRTSRRPSRDSSSVATDLLVLSGNALTDEMKADLQHKLGYILHTLAATHETVGYCQGMDYVVAHLLRILQDTIRWRAANGTLPASILSAPHHKETQDVDSLSPNFEGVDKTLVVEETVFKVMDSLFTTYNLQHMYWPELRCLKTCCRVFERLIQLKLPVLADHFEHHELNVGLFALGWFQTLFLYLPSMPSATVCHMWDIWLVERSFKIFFRVGTAILFLSQPILLNHELEGMMTYLNTFPDATLLNPDILIACALQIKVTNKMLMEIEADVGGSH